MDSIEKVVQWLVKLLKVVGGIALMGMMSITCIDVVLRAYGRPIFGSVDIVGFLATAVLACAMPYTHSEGGHVGVSLFVQRLSPRKQAVIDSITSIVGFALFAVVSWQMWLYAISLKKAGEVSMAIQIPIYPFIYGISVCFGVLCLVILINVVNLIGKAVKS